MILRKSAIIAAIGVTTAAAQPSSKPMPAAPATAPPTTTNCLIASTVYVEHDDNQTNKMLAHEALIFYLGRLDPTINAAQLKAQLQLAVKDLKDVSAAGLMNDCLQELRAKAQAFKSVGQLNAEK